MAPVASLPQGTVERGDAVGEEEQSPPVAPAHGSDPWGERDAEALLVVLAVSGADFEEVWEQGFNPATESPLHGSVDLDVGVIELVHGSPFTMQGVDGVGVTEGIWALAVARNRTRSKATATTILGRLSLRLVNYCVDSTVGNFVGLQMSVARRFNSRSQKTPRRDEFQTGVCANFKLDAGVRRFLLLPILPRYSPAHAP